MNPTATPGCTCPCCSCPCPYCTLLALVGQLKALGVTPDTAAQLSLDFVEWVGYNCPCPPPVPVKAEVVLGQPK
jgi:hypothetical protein